MSVGATHLQCLCGAVREQASLLDCTKLPIETELCHCNLCRQTSGALFGAFAKLRHKPASIGACGRYARVGGRVDRYFCLTCGTRTFDHVTDTDYWLACAGIIESDGSQDNVIKVLQHEYVSDTKDGGLAHVLRSLQGRTIPCYADGKETSKVEMTTAQLAQLSEVSPGSKEDKLRASCHCGAIQFDITPPQPGTSRGMRADGTKYLAKSCACRSCRLACGFSFASYTYVPPENIIAAGRPQTTSNKTEVSLEHENADSTFGYTSQAQSIPNFASTEHLQGVFPGLKFYRSSPKIRWSFCSTCGASIFVEDEARPQLTNISLGLLRAQSGALAKNWVDFVWKPWWASESEIDMQFIEAFEKESDRTGQDKDAE